MKITSTLISIPPFLSTTWDNVASLLLRNSNEEAILVVTLQDRTQVEIPSLSVEELKEIFDAHARFSTVRPSEEAGPLGFSLPLKADGTLDGLSSSMMHNSEQSNLPPLPPQILNKITLITRALGLDTETTLPKAEPHCNCVYCQVARAMQGEEAIESEEEVTEEDLKFRTWDIKQTAEKLYLVSNPLDSNEHYGVFLGEPLGCTCGQRHCEHLCAVLNS